MKKVTILLIVGVSLGVARGQALYSVSPVPKRIEVGKGYFLFPKTVLIAVASTEPALRRMAEDLALRIGQTSGHDTRVFAGNFRVKDGINLVLGKDSKLGEKGYFLEVTPSRIIITAEQTGGFASGLHALKQLMPKAIFDTERVPGVSWKIPCCYIEDQPR